MKHVPPIELLEATHQFPVDFVFKVIGRSDDGFLSRVLANARLANAMETDPAFTVRQTSGGKHISITLTIHVESAARVQAVYAGLSGMEGLILLM